ncbi:response regulator receiver domain-containing protein [Desulfobotulus alkaliphilus]|uniref:Response regulator receiver domain-containing protein n=1 Tax=Desulfobotulus alkaliphilus TaxID=622671 RepID=A0A562S0S5_9BACT|nr:response regulator [Desulfobotulus alkaliphilus]TWI74170.1 response regulator receiver domain-containing protein [Desulfobotulus alkaliphilus]
MIKRKVLLTDDETGFVETLSKRLEKRDFRLAAAFSGDEALRVLAENPWVDVVILDVKMPGMDGIETLSRIKLEFPLVEVIMLTGHATVETAIDGMKKGAFDYLMKPCDIDILTAKVDEATARKKAHEEKIVSAKAMAIANQRGD